MAMTSYHCKFLIGMGEWDTVDILPASMSGELGQLSSVDSNLTGGDNLSHS